MWLPAQHGLRKNGGVWAWGYNYYGQLGDGTLTNRQVPKLITSLTDIQHQRADSTAAIKMNLPVPFSG